MIQAPSRMHVLIWVVLIEERIPPRPPFAGVRNHAISLYLQFAVWTTRWWLPQRTLTSLLTAIPAVLVVSSKIMSSSGYMQLLVLDMEVCEFPLPIYIEMRVMKWKTGPGRCGSVMNVINSCDTKMPLKWLIFVNFSSNKKAVSSCMGQDRSRSPRDLE
jgi:hypothetical protein